MILALHVIEAQDDAAARDPRKRFGERGGTIGRAETNEWILQHGFVSQNHARISFADGVFYIEDLESTNGTFINGSTTRLAPRQRCALQSNQTIRLGPFTVGVSIEEGEDRAEWSASSDRFDAPQDRNRDAGYRGGNQSTGRAFDDDASDSSLLSGLPPLGGKRARHTPSYRPPSIEHDRMATRGPIEEPRDISEDDAHAPHESAAIPKGYDPAKSEILVPARQSSAAQPPVTPSRGPVRAEARSPERELAHAVAAPPGGGATGNAADPLAAMFAAAGLAHVQVTPAVAEAIGHIFRTVVEGVMEVLRDRRDVKRELEVELTQFGQKNNPLKYSTSVDDALHKLFASREPGYMGPVEAFDDAFVDLRHHQAAMLAGVQATFDALLTTFAPDNLAATFDRRSKSSAAVPWPGKVRYWDQYNEWFDDMVKNKDAAVSKVFKNEFADAYDAALEQLLNNRVAKPRTPR